MACKVLSFKRPNLGLRQTLKEPEKGSNLDGKLLNSTEMEIISKINIIVGDLRELEENFSKLRQDLLKKTTIEGRENSKICAVQGKVISKNYYKNLGEDIDSLSKVFQDQFKKITKEIISISALSRGKLELRHGSSGDNGNFNLFAEPSTPLVNPNLRHAELPVIRHLKTFETKPNSGLKEKFHVPFTIRTEPIQEGAVPKTIRRPTKPKMMPYTFAQTDMQAVESVPLAHGNYEAEGQVMSPIGHSSLEMEREKEWHQEETEKIQMMSDSSEEDYQEDVVSLKRRSSYLSFTDENSSENEVDFKF